MPEPSEDDTRLLQEFAFWGEKGKNHYREAKMYVSNEFAWVGMTYRNDSAYHLAYFEVSLPFEGITKTTYFLNKRAEDYWFWGHRFFEGVSNRNAKIKKPDEVAAFLLDAYWFGKMDGCESHRNFAFTQYFLGKQLMEAHRGRDLVLANTISSVCWDLLETELIQYQIRLHDWSHFYATLPPYEESLVDMTDYFKKWREPEWETYFETFVEERRIAEYPVEYVMADEPDPLEYIYEKLWTPSQSEERVKQELLDFSKAYRITDELDDDLDYPMETAERETLQAFRQTVKDGTADECRKLIGSITRCQRKWPDNPYFVLLKKDVYKSFCRSTKIADINNLLRDRYPDFLHTKLFTYPAKERNTEWVYRNIYHEKLTPNQVFPHRTVFTTDEVTIFCFVMFDYFLHRKHDLGAALQYHKLLRPLIKYPSFGWFDFITDQLNKRIRPYVEKLVLESVDDHIRRKNLIKRIMGDGITGLPE